MSLTAHQQNISRCLQQEITAASILLDALLQEQNALLNNSVTAIERALASKQQPIADLEKLNRQREEILRSKNYPENHAGMATYIHDHDPQDSQKLNTLWQQLQNLGAQCLQQNQLNGSIISTKRIYTHSALSILRGQGLEHPDCYTPAGQAQAKFQSQTLGQA